MKTILELSQPLWMSTPHGEGLALFLTDHGAESDHLWTCVTQEGEHAGELWTWHNSEVRLLPNRSMLRGRPEELSRVNGGAGHYRVVPIANEPEIVERLEAETRRADANAASCRHFQEALRSIANNFFGAARQIAVRALETHVDAVVGEKMPAKEGKS